MLLYNKEIFNRVFDFRGRYRYKNIKMIPTYFREIHFLVKHGYPSIAQWDTFGWFIDTMKPILENYLENRSGTPFPDGHNMDDEIDWDEVSDKWDEELKRMIRNLELMNEDNLLDGLETNDPDFVKKYDERGKMMDKAKNEFFESFSRNFYRLWD